MEINHRGIEEDSPYTPPSSSYESQEDINSEGFECSNFNDDNESFDFDNEPLYSNEGSGGHHQNNSTNETHQMKQNLMEYKKLLKHIEYLNDVLKEKELNLKAKRDKLTMCRGDIEKIEKEIKQNEAILEANRTNRASSDLTCHKIQRLKGELSIKENEQEMLQELIHKEELAVSESVLAISEYEDVRPDLDKYMTMLNHQKAKQAMLRIQGQTRHMIEARRFDMMKERESMKEKNKDIRNKQSVKSSKQFTSAPPRLKSEHKSIADDGHVKQRMDAMLNLKKNIDSNKDYLQAQHLKAKEKEKKLQAEEIEEKKRIFESGCDPNEVIMKRKLLQQLKKEKEDLDQEQKKRQLEILTRIVDETKRDHEGVKEKATSQRKQLKQPKEDVNKQQKQVEIEEDKPKENNGIIEEIDTTRAKEKEPIHEDIQHTIEEERSVLKPDIPGLWESNVDEVEVKKSKRTIMEQSIYDRTLVDLKNSAVITQVAAGREFKGQAFISKPEEIIFKDFEIGKIYKKKIQLTNISYTVNHLKLVNVSENLMDFLQIEFKPPGAISAGLTCSMVVIFEPKLNEDITGSIQFLSQTGPFSITVKCITKKCLISVDSRDIAFGVVYIGEEKEKSLTIRNEGCLPASFIISHSPAISPSSSSSTMQTKNGIDPDESKHQPASPSQRSMLSTVEFPTTEKIAQLKKLELHSHSMSEIGSLTNSRVQFERRSATEKKTPELNLEGEKCIKDKEEQEINDEGSPAHTDEHIIEERDDTPPPPNVFTFTKMPTDILEPHSSITLSIVFAPLMAVGYTSQFQLITNNNKCDDPVIITVGGKGDDVPIYVEEESVDLKICMVGLLYQTSVILHNRSTVPLQATFTIPPVFKKHMEIVPKYGLVQSKSSFAAQLKFFPGKDIFHEGIDFFTNDIEPLTLQVPINIAISGQSSPVQFIVKAIVTESDIQLSQTDFDFEECTVLESLVTTISLTNKSCLPQDYGFIHLPQWLSVQPNDGFGTLLPYETLTLDVIFSPDLPQHYSCDKILLKTAIDKSYKLSCKGIGVLPALDLSHSLISFAPTPVNTVSTVHIQVVNPLLSSTDASVIRGLAPKKGDRIFEFAIPRNFPVSISPLVGRVKPGLSADVEVSFHPVLYHKKIEDVAIELASIAAAKIAAEEAEKAAKEEEQQQQLMKNQKGRKGNSKGNSKAGSRAGSRMNNKTALASDSKKSVGSTSQEESLAATPKNKVEMPSLDSLPWLEAYTKVITEYRSQSYQYSIPCFISNPVPSGHDQQHQLKSEEVIYLDVVGVAIRPSLMVTSNNGSSFINFGSVAAGDVMDKSVVLKNISSKILKPTCKTCLDPMDGFQMRNALRDIMPDSTHTLLLQFAPENCWKYHEVLQIGYDDSYLELSLGGQGVEPVVNITPGTGELDWGYVMVNDSSVKNLQIENLSELPIRFNLKMSSLTSIHLNGPANFNGQPLFTCVPCTGVVPLNKTVDISICFNPDRSECLFSDSLHIDINDKTKQTISLRGYSSPTNMYITDVQSIGPKETLMVAVPSASSEESSGPSLPLLMVFKGNLSQSTSFSQQFHISCIKTQLVKKPKSEYVIEPLQSSDPSDAKCFTIDPMKSAIDSGETRQITVTFTPLKDSNKQLYQALTTVILKGDTTVHYKLLLQALTYYSES